MLFYDVIREFSWVFFLDCLNYLNKGFGWLCNFIVKKRLCVDFGMDMEVVNENIKLLRSMWICLFVGCFVNGFYDYIFKVSINSWLMNFDNLKIN